MWRLVRDSGTLAVATTQTGPRAAGRHPQPRSAGQASERRRLADGLCAPSSHGPCDTNIVLLTTQIKHWARTTQGDHALKLKVTFCVRGVISPLLSNVYLNEVDRMLERAKEVTRYERWTSVEYARFADDLVVLVDAHPRQHWLRTAVDRRLREVLATLHVEVNEEKTRRVDLTQGERFGFLGFDFRRIRSRRDRWMPLHTPQGKKRTALLRTLKQIFRSHRSRPISDVIAKINPMLRGWVQYFAVGHSSRCFSYIRDWVEKKIRHHLVRASQRHGFGWKRWSKAWLYGTLGLFAEYRVAR